MTELEMIVDLHLNMDRLGPGSQDETLKALEYVNLQQNGILNIADFGCGTGNQSLLLAEHLKARITAVDLFPKFLNKLIERAKNSALSNKIDTRVEDLNDLSIEPYSLDLIWSEGAIYNIGFENGIKSWKKYLKPGGFLAVTDITWITGRRPKTIEDYWSGIYPEIDRASSKIQILEDNGYTLTGYFYLKKKSWLTNYYHPLESAFDHFLRRHDNAKLAHKIVEENLFEIQQYQKYGKYYSYGFYIARSDD